MKMIKNLLIMIVMVSATNTCQAHGDGSHHHEPIKQQEESQKNELRLFQTGKTVELVLVINSTSKPNTTILISDLETNQPISKAVIDVTISEHTLKADQGSSPGIYHTHLPPLSSSSFSLTIVKPSGGKESFIFENISLQHPTNSFWTKWLTGVLLSIVIIFAGIGGSKYARKKGIFILVFLFISSPLQAHGDDHHNHEEEHGPDNNHSHQHGEETDDDHNHSYLATKNAQNLIINKDVQFHMGILTQRVVEKSLKGSIRLIGKVISDPTGYARIQASQPAYVLSHQDHPLPLPGQKVKIGDVLVVLNPIISKVETTTQKNALYKAESEIDQFSKEVERLEKLGRNAIQKHLDNARAELEKALKQKEEILRQTFKSEYMRSPINGVISDLHVRPGEIVTPEKIIMDVVDPDKYLIEAQVFDPNISEQLIGGYAKSTFHSDETVPLKVIGVSPKVDSQDQSIHVLFRPEKSNLDIKLDMTIEIIGELKETKSALIVPISSVIREKIGAWVFVAINPETFEPRRVRIRRIIDDFAEIEEGVTLGEKIVTEGAYLLYQAM